MFNKHCLIALFVFFIFVGGGLWLLPTWQEHRRTRRSLNLKRREVRMCELEGVRLSEEIHRLKTDKRAIERVARDKFGWCRPEEKVYEFGKKPRYSRRFMK